MVKLDMEPGFNGQAKIVLNCEAFRGVMMAVTFTPYCATSLDMSIWGLSDHEPGVGEKQIEAVGLERPLFMLEGRIKVRLKIQNLVFVKNKSNLELTC